MNSILIIEDDLTFSSLLKDAFTELDFKAHSTNNHESTTQLIENTKIKFTHCLLDLGLPSGSGLSLITPLLNKYPGLKIVVLTGFANVPTAVEAIKLGALYYLSKPAELKDIIKAFERDMGNPSMPLHSDFNLDKREKEHVLAVLQKNHFNISISAKELGMHRRTLQRKIIKWGLKNN